VDPTCVSPDLVDGTEPWTARIQRWQGMGIINDMLLVGGSTIQLLSLVNYAIFVLLGTVVQGLVLVAVDRLKRWKVLLAIVPTWWTLEAGRWFYAALQLSRRTVENRFLVDPVTYFVFVALLLPMILVTYLTLRPQPGPARSR
jgi:hypothetical protein